MATFPCSSHGPAEQARKSRALRNPGRNPEKWIERLLLASTALSAVAILSILGLLLFFCLPLLTSGKLLEVFSWQWRPFGGKFGILAMCEASLCLSLLALTLALPPSLAVCCLISGLLRGKGARYFSVLIHFMTSIPTVIYGFVSVFLLVPFMRSWFDAGSGFSLLTAGLTLSLLILPTMVLVLKASLDRIDRSLILAGEAMGLTPLQQMRHILIPAASRGLILAAVLGFGRAIGDTLVSLMLAGNAAQPVTSLMASARTLTAHIALVLATDSQSMAYQSVFAAGLVLFVIMGVISLLIRKIGERP